MIWLLLSCARGPSALDLPAPSTCTLQAADAMISLSCDDRVLLLGQALGGLDAARIELGGAYTWLDHPAPDRSGVAWYQQETEGLTAGAFARAIGPTRGQWAMCVSGSDSFQARCAPTLKALAQGQVPDLRPFHDPPYAPLQWGARAIELPPGCWLEQDPRGQRAVCGLDSLFLFPVAARMGPDVLAASLQPGMQPVACAVDGLPALCSLSLAKTPADTAAPTLIGAVVELPDGSVWGAACTFLNEGQGLPPICAALITWPAPQ